MTILSPTADTSKSVSILNSGGYSPRYADVPDAHSTENNSVTIETLLRSIDGRLQSMDGRLDNMDKRLDKIDKRLDKVSEDIVELKIQTVALGVRLVGVEERFDRTDERFDRSDERLNRAEDRFLRQEEQQREADGRLVRIEAQLERLPSWKSMGATSATTIVTCCALFGWLAEGGARTLAGIFD
jgi:archaellum component FlaC